MKGRRLTTFAHGEGGFGVQRTLHAAVQHGPSGLAGGGQISAAHAAPQWMLDAADYVTEMKCCRHPYQKGIAARKGIEY